MSRARSEPGPSPADLLDVLVAPGALGVYAPALAAAGVVLLTALPALLERWVPDLPVRAAARWWGTAATGASAALAVSVACWIGGGGGRRVAGGPPAGGMAALVGGGGAVVGDLAASALAGWLQAAWPTHPVATWSVVLAVAGAVAGVAIGAAAGPRGSALAAGVGALVLVAVHHGGSLAGSDRFGPAPAGEGPFSAWVLASTFAALVSVAAVLVPPAGIRMAVRTGRRAGWEFPVGDAPARLGSSKRLCSVYLPASEGIAPRHVELRPHRGGLLVIPLCGSGWDPLESTCRHASLSIL